MAHQALHRVPVLSVPADLVSNESADLVLHRGERRALIVPDRWQARRLADMIAGLEPPPNGIQVECDGPVRLVPADGGLLPYLTVLGNLMHGDRTARKVPRDTAKTECRATAGRCGLDDVLDQYPYAITPGRRRLAGLARALCARPVAVVLEDAAGLPTWGELLDFERNPENADLEHSTENPELPAVVLLLITANPDRAAGFSVPKAAGPGEQAGPDGDDGGHFGGTESRGA